MRCRASTEGIKSAETGELRELAAHRLLREAEDEQVEVLIGSRTYRLRRVEVRSA